MVPKLASWADIAIEGGAADLKFLAEIRYVGLPGGHGGLQRTTPNTAPFSALPLEGRRAEGYRRPSGYHPGVQPSGAVE